MKITLFPYKNVQDYLDAMGVLEHGTVEDIAQARKIFRKLYLKQYQKTRYTKTHTNITVSFSKAEKAILQQLAIDNGKKLSSYIKMVALDATKHSKSDINKAIDLTELKRLLSLSYDIVELLHFENNDAELQQSYDELLELFEQLEALLK